MILLGCALASLAAAVALVPLCRLVAERLGFVATPKQDRWHRRPVPLLGGVAIAAPPIIGALALAPWHDVALLVFCCTAAFVIGLVDDAVHLKPQAKLVPIIALASLLTFSGYRLGWFESMTLDALVTLIWLVGITNAMNLLDNMDGLAAGVGTIAMFAMLAGIYPSAGVSPNAIFLALILGSTVGFLLFNFHPARIFMGDSGSLFIGLALATIGLQYAHEAATTSNVLAVIAAPLFILLIPIFDTTFVTVSRILSGRRPSQGGRDHSSHRLVAIGLPERTAVVVLWSLSALGGTVALAFQLPRRDAPVIAAVLFVLAMIVFAAYLSRVRVYDEQDSRLKSGRITPFVARAMHKKRVLEILLDVALVAVAYYSAYRLRFETRAYSYFFRSFLSSLPLVIGIQMVSFHVVGVYRGAWRTFGLMDAVVLAKGVLIGTVASVVAILFLFRFEDYSRGVFVIYAALLTLLAVGSKASFRLMSEFVRRRQQGQRLLVYGAGAGGSLVARELMNLERANHRMLGFIDDDPAKLRMRIQGYPVLGGYENLVSLAMGGAVDVLVISTNHLELARVRQVEALCAAHGVKLEKLLFRLEEVHIAS